MTEGSPDPYSLLGIAPESSFEDVQVARQAKLDAVGDAPIPRARVEAAYDTILMDRLKERQQGRVSSAARSASQKETLPTPPRPLAKLQQLPSLPLPRLGGSGKAGSPLTFALATGRERLFPLITHGTLLVLMLVLPASAPESLLALGALATLLNLLRRNGRFFQAVGCTLLLLALGLGLSIGLLAAVGSPSALALPIGPAQVQGALALVVLLLGALFIA